MNLLPIPFSFIQERFLLSWRDALWGYEHQIIGWPVIVDLAKNRSGISLNTRETELSCLGKSDTPRIGELLRELAASESQGMGEMSVKKWLFLMLAWIFDNRNRIEDPLSEVEMIYADFDYPVEIESFVRYMPVTDGYDPTLHSSEENNDRLFANWKKYLDDRVCSRK